VLIFITYDGWKSFTSKTTYINWWKYFEVKPDCTYRYIFFYIIKQYLHALLFYWKGVLIFNQLLAQGRWLSPGTLASSSTKTGRHDIADILLKVALNKINQNTSNQYSCMLNKHDTRLGVWSGFPHHNLTPPNPACPIRHIGKFCVVLPWEPSQCTGIDNK
jgi:hypothetical protein